MERHQLEHRSLQMGTVVETRAQNDLRVHPDPGLCEPLEPRKDFGRVPRPTEKRVPQLRVGGVDRDIQGREALLDDALERAFVEVAERDVVAVQER